MSSFYFQLQPEGLGTPEVECLGSYVHRLAEAHGASFYQLMAHLRHWAAFRSSGVLPRHSESVRYSGYSRDVGPLVAALEEVTGLHTLKCCTLLSLRNVCAGNGIGALKATRAWCPACYHEAEYKEAVVYDRLYWQLQGVTRCFVHDIELKQTCESCGSVQRNNCAKTLIACCERCEERLAKAPEHWTHVRYPDAIQAQVRSLLQHTSSDASALFELGKVDEFCEAMMAVYTRPVLIQQFGEAFHKRWWPFKMRLATMLLFAARFNVPLVSILTEGKHAAAQISIGFEFAPIEGPVSRRNIDSGRLDRAWDLLQEAIEQGPPYPPVKAIMSLAEVSQGYARHHFGQEVRNYTKLRRLHLTRERQKLIKRITKLANESPIVRALPHQKSREKWLANETGASTRQVRTILSAPQRTAMS